MFNGKAFAMLAGVAGLTYTSKRYFQSNIAQAEETETKEFEIDFADELEEGMMRELKVGPKDKDKVLVARF